MAVITIPKVLREKLGEDGADSIIELINLANQQVKEDVIELSGEKFERRLTEEMSKLRSEDLATLRSVDLANLDKRITEEVAKLDKRITEEIGRLRSEDLPKLDKRITDEVANLKVELIKWQVGMFVTTVILILGLYATIIFK